MKVLKIKEIKNEEGITTQIQIIKQSHICEQFAHGRSRFIHKNFILESIYGPQADPDCNRLFVRGLHHSRDHHIINVPSQRWLKQLLEAINAYSKHFSNCEDCIERHCNNCEIKKKFFIIGDLKCLM